MSDPELRVSVATLCRVVFHHPQDATPMIALERKATVTVSESQPQVTVRAQPFGGAVRLGNPSALHARIGSFRFDSRRSETEADFRIMIRASQWPVVKGFCLHHLEHPGDGVLETSPDRELVEEFHDTMEARLTPEQYSTRVLATLIENQPAGTSNIQALGHPTVRIYHVFEARVQNDSLARAMIENSDQYSDADLCQLAMRDFRNVGARRANAVLTLPLRWLARRYLALSPESRGELVEMDGHLLDGNVAAVLDGVPVPKYQRV